MTTPEHIKEYFLAVFGPEAAYCGIGCNPAYALELAQAGVTCWMHLFNTSDFKPLQKQIEELKLTEKFFLSNQKPGGAFAQEQPVRLMCIDAPGHLADVLNGLKGFLDQPKELTLLVHTLDIPENDIAQLTALHFEERPWVDTDFRLFVRQSVAVVTENAPENVPAAHLPAPKIHLIIPSYNCARWIDRCLHSVVKNYVGKPVSLGTVLVIDDAGTEKGYAEKTIALCKAYGFHYLRNPVNRKCPYNIWLAMQMLDAAPEDVIFLLDGDDALPEHALSRISEIYTDPQVWLTYGNYEPIDEKGKKKNTGQVLASAYPLEVLQARNFRNSPVGNLYNHPLTFRKFLFDAIAVKDMQRPDGQWFTGGYDFVLMIPMLEMAGKDHLVFINEVLYLYNAVNPISDSSVNVDLVKESWVIKQYPPYPLLDREVLRAQESGNQYEKAVEYLKKAVI